LLLTNAHPRELTEYCYRDILFDYRFLYLLSWRARDLLPTLFSATSPWLIMVAVKLARIFY